MRLRQDKNNVKAPFLLWKCGSYSPPSSISSEIASSSQVLLDRVKPIQVGVQGDCVEGCRKCVSPYQLKCVNKWFCFQDRSGRKKGTCCGIRGNQDLFNQKGQEFIPKENKSSQFSTKQWLGEYIYSDIHELFFVEILIILFEWLAQLSFQKRKFQGGEHDDLTYELIQQL